VPRGAAGGRSGARVRRRKVRGPAGAAGGQEHPRSQVREGVCFRCLRAPQRMRDQPKGEDRR
jgi:hypothetical protein